MSTCISRTGFLLSNLSGINNFHIARPSRKAAEEQSNDDPASKSIGKNLEEEARCHPPESTSPGRHRQTVAHIMYVISWKRFTERGSPTQFFCRDVALLYNSYRVVLPC